MLCLLYIFVAPCDVPMVFSSDYPVTTSSPGLSPEGLTEEGVDAWTPSEDDASPTVVIEVGAEPVLIGSLEVTNEKTTGVKEVIVVVKDSEGNTVVRNATLCIDIVNNLSICELCVLWIDS